MIKDFQRVRKGWPIDIFWGRKQNAIREIETAQPGEPGDRREIDDPVLLARVHQVLAAFDKSEKARRFLFVKLLLAWLIAYGLTVGEVPWFLLEAWTVAEWAGSGVFDAVAGFAAR